MYKNDFDAFLRTHIPRASLLYGESAYLIELYIKQLLASMELEACVFHYGEYDRDVVLEMLRHSNLFGGGVCVVLKIEKRLSDKELKAMLHALAKNTSHNLIIGFFRAENKSPTQYARECKSMAACFMQVDKSNNLTHKVKRSKEKNSTSQILQADTRSAKIISTNNKEYALNTHDNSSLPCPASNDKAEGNALNSYDATSAKSSHKQDDMRIYALHKGDKTQDMAKNGVLEVRFFTPSPNEALELLRKEAQHMGLELGRELLESMLAMQHFDIALACNELRKLTILDAPPTRTDIASLCYGLGSVDINALLVAVFEKGDVARIFTEMIEGGLHNELSLVGEVEQYVYKVFLFAAYMRLHGKPDSKAILGYALPFKEAELLTKRAIKLKETVFLRMFKVLGAWRGGIMKGEKSLRYLIKLQALAS